MKYLNIFSWWEIEREEEMKETRKWFSKLKLFLHSNTRESGNYLDRADVSGDLINKHSTDDLLGGIGKRKSTKTFGRSILDMDFIQR